MKQLLDFKNYRKMLLIMALFFIFLSITIHLLNNFWLYRFLRGVICYTILLYLWFVHGKSLPKWIAFFLLFYGASSIATVWYENNWMASLTMALNFCAILFLIGFVLPKLNFKKMSRVFTALFIIVIIVDGYLLFQLVELFKGMTLGTTHYIFMVLAAMSVVFLGFLALVYNHLYNSKTSFVFTIFVFLIIFAEIFRGIGYYNLSYSYVFIYLARIFLVMALSALVHFSFLLKPSTKKI